MTRWIGSYNCDHADQRPKYQLLKHIANAQKISIRLSRHIYCSAVIMSPMASQITSLTIVYSHFFFSGTDQRKHQSSASLAFVRGIHRWPVNSPHKGPVKRTMFPFDDVIMLCSVENWRKSWRSVTFVCYSSILNHVNTTQSWSIVISPCAALFVSTDLILQIRIWWDNELHPDLWHDKLNFQTNMNSSRTCWPVINFRQASACMLNLWKGYKHNNSPRWYKKWYHINNPLKRNEI